MRIGVPKEIKADERRVAIVPSGVAAFRAHNHRVMVEKGAGLGSGISNGAAWCEAWARKSSRNPAISGSAPK